MTLTAAPAIPQARTPSNVSLAPERIRLLVVDDHPAVRRGVRELLEEQPDFSLVGSAATAEEAVSIIERDRVDVAVVDFQLRRRNGLWLSRKLKRMTEGPRVLIYSAYTDDLLTAAAALAGADGVISKGVLGGDLTAAIRRIAGGAVLLPPLAPPAGELLRHLLDDEEQAIFGMTLAGIPKCEVAAIVRLSMPELESRLATMLRKLECDPGGGLSPAIRS